MVSQGGDFEDFTLDRHDDLRLCYFLNEAFDSFAQAMSIAIDECRDEGWPFPGELHRIDERARAGSRSAKRLMKRIRRELRQFCRDTGVMYPATGTMLDDRIL
jgi:hypothetical protein